MTDETPPPPTPVVAIEEARSEFEEEMTRAAYAYEGRYSKKDAPARRHGFAEGARWANGRSAEALRAATARAERLEEALRYIRGMCLPRSDGTAREVLVEVRAALASTEEGQG